MPAVVAIPQVVEELLVQFGDYFPNKPSRRHFAEYLTGLLVAEHKTISGIAREFACPPDQSALNRWLTEASWNADDINRHCLEWMQRYPTTRFRQDGVIAIDTTLIDHDGKLIEDAGVLLGPRRAAPQNRPRLSVCKLRPSRWQALSARLPALS